MHEDNLSTRTGSMCSSSGNSNDNNIKIPRRTSVTPVTQKSSLAPQPSRNSLCNNTTTISLSNEAATSFPSDKLRRMSVLFSIDRSKAREVIMAVLEDPARTEFKRLKIENDCLTSEWKQVRKILGQLQADYETSRSLDPLRRFKSLQGMVKRIVMHIRITEQSSLKKFSTQSENSSEITLQGDVLKSETKAREMEKRVGRMCDNYSIEELTIQNRRLNESNDRLENRLQLIIHKINELDNLYNSIRNDGFFKRYTILKDAVKRIVTNHDLYENP
ncbi:unnamed protein product [Schistosoma rodhaini]|uniref:Uncharacterized protein n=1 Tax=Schistosoma rodhaini TaxID=6188 RepID=A0AA85GGZ6_9TREM|nr:unnamed protein product [Schistosoma rodhaini]